MDAQKRIVLAHMGFSNKEQRKFHRENSKEVCEISGNAAGISIIELDLRKSRDGILYCYHGTLFQYYVGLKSPKMFSEIAKAYKVNSFEEIVTVIPGNKRLFLDIKDASITKDDIERIFQNRKFEEIILGNKSVSFLRRFDGLPPVFVKSLNGNAFFGWYDFEKLKKENFRYVEAVFPFQVTEKTIERARRAGLEFHVAGLFCLSNESYWNIIKRYGIKIVNSDFI